MKRREFITLLGGSAVTWPLVARAQSERMRRVGVLMAYAESDPEGRAFLAAFQEGLQQLGWTKGRNARIDTRWTTPDREARQRFAKELVALQPDVILSPSTPATAAVLQETAPSPSFSRSCRSAWQRHRASLPGRVAKFDRITITQPTITCKRLKVLKEIVPRVARVAHLFNLATATYAEYYLNPFKAAAPVKFELDRSTSRPPRRSVSTCLRSPPAACRRMADRISALQPRTSFAAVHEFVLAPKLPKGRMRRLVRTRRKPTVHPRAIFDQPSELLKRRQCEGRIR